MPKGKILMGKDPKPDGKKRPIPMPKAKSGKPAPKGGKVIEKARSIVNTILPGKPGEAKQSMPSFLRKTKPVMPMPSFLRKTKPVQPRTNKKNETVTVYSKLAPLANRLDKTKPVMPRRGGK